MIIKVTDNIILRSINPSDTDFVLKINNDPKIKKFFPRKEIIIKEQHISFLEKCIEKGDYYFMIDWYNFPVSFPIGTVSIYNIDKENKSAEWGRFIIVEEFKGYGVLVEKKIIDIAFNTLKLNKLYCNTLSNNTRTIEMHKLLGFKIEEVRKEQVIIDEQYHDFVYMSIYKKEKENGHN